MVLITNLGATQLAAAASGALQSQTAVASAAAAAEIAAIGVNNWGASLSLAACGAAAGAAAVAGAAGKLRCGGGQAEDCPDGNWRAPKEETVQAVPQGQSWGMLATPFAMTLVSIPALLGSWCWPLLIAVAFGASGVSTAKTRAVSHSLSWGLHIGALGALAVYVASRTPGDRASSGPLLRWAPLVLIVLGSLMMLLDLTRHVLLDQDIAPVHLHMYNKDGSLTAVGEMGMYCTWFGVLLLVIGTGWFLNYQEKIAGLYRSVFGKGSVPSPAAPQERA